MKIKILYEDSNILAIDKPSGILVHPDERSKEKTIYDLFVKKYPELAIVHRLDRDTSGVLLLAKNEKTHKFLKRQFMGRSVKKIYHCIVNGSVKQDSGTIKKSIGRSPSDFRKWLAGRGARGELREAETFYKVLKRFSEKENNFTYLEVRPKTGRTHQIRVHMKYLNHPVACDSLYNPGKPCPKGFKRLALHARSIEFKIQGGKTLKIESPLPKEFKALE
jgi:RluA family pseudouridine synthase